MWLNDRRDRLRTDPVRVNDEPDRERPRTHPETPL
jgi:hypothetical protein